MTGGAVLKAAAGGVARRRVQAAVVFLVVTAAAAACLLGLTLATSSNEAFLTAFTASHEPDLAVRVSSAKVTGAELAKSRHLPGVTNAAGPDPETTVQLGIVGGGSSAQPLTVVGRMSPTAPMDDTEQNAGRWATRLGEIDLAPYSPSGGSIGQVATVTSVPSKPGLTIVGTASSVVQNLEDGWVTPGEITALEKAGAPVQEQMLYTFSRASTPAQINADLSELKAALPGGAIVGYTSWLNTDYLRAAENGGSTPFVVAYACMGLLLAVVIIGSVVAAAAAVSYRRIGLLKSIGFTPAQIVASYLAQLGAPAVAGAVAGTVLGNRWVLPLISSGPFNVAVTVPLWINITVPTGLLALTGLAVLVPALRAGRMSAVAAIAAGQAPRTGHGYAAHRLAGKMSLPRPVAIGLAAPFARPARSVVTLVTVAVGMTAVVIAVGLNTSMAHLVTSAGAADTDTALVLRLTLLVAFLAGIGVFTSVLTVAREREHDLGVFKALGATPRQIIVMVGCWAVVPAIAAAAIAVPAGVALEGSIAGAVVSVQADQLANIAVPGAARSGNRPHQPPVRPGRPGEVLNGGGSGARPRAGNPLQAAHRFLFSRTAANAGQVYTAEELALLVMAGLAIALAGALGPAAWATVSMTTAALHTE